MQAEAIEKVITGGDLSQLTPDQRLSYYKSVCDSVGLNFLTQPLQYLRLNGKLVLYATKACTDQLRQLHNVSVMAMDVSEVKDVYITTVRVQNNEGRSDMSRGAVAIGNLSGEALANALMKSETKAKRRATLSICGLSILDESEVEALEADRSNVADVDEGMHQRDWQMHVENLIRATTDEQLKEEFRKAYRKAKETKDQEAAEFLIHIKDVRKAQLAAAGVEVKEDNRDAEPATESAEEPQGIKVIAAELQKKLEARREQAKKKEPTKLADIEAPKVF